MYKITKVWRAELLLKVSALTITILLITLLPITLTRAASSLILINAIYYDTYLSFEPDEAFQVINISASPVDLTNWTIIDFEGAVSPTGILASGQTFWIDREAMISIWNFASNRPMSINQIQTPST